MSCPCLRRGTFVRARSRSPLSLSLSLFTDCAPARGRNFVTSCAARARAHLAIGISSWEFVHGLPQVGIFRAESRALAGAFAGLPLLARDFITRDVGVGYGILSAVLEAICRISSHLANSLPSFLVSSLLSYHYPLPFSLSLSLSLSLSCSLSSSGSECSE